MNWSRIVPAAATLALALASNALAGGTPLGSDFTYQGLLENGGVPQNGAFDMQFSLFDAAAAGAQIGATLQINNITVSDGTFTATLNFGPAAFAGERRWLQIAVKPSAAGVFTTLSPRQQVTPAPHALFALNAGLLPPIYNPAVQFNNTANNYLGSGARMHNAGGTATVELIGQGLVGEGVVNVRNATAIVTAGLDGDRGAQGGEIFTNSEDGFRQLRVEADVSPPGEGLFLAMQRSNAASGFVFDGNFGGSLNPRIDISGTASAMAFNTNAAGNDSVLFPVSSIAATEMFDEPGVANNHANFTAIDTTGVVTVLTSRSITVPGPGFVLVMAQGDLSISHTTGTTTNIAFGVSDDPAILPVNQDIQVVLPSALPSAGYDFSASAHGIFTVPAAGTFTFFFLGDEFAGAGSSSMFDINFTLVYFPTAYGVVVSNTPPAAMRGEDNTGNDLSLPPRPGLTASEIAAEQAEATAFHEARMADEFEMMRLQLQQMQIRLAQLEQEQNAGRSGAAGGGGR